MNIRLMSWICETLFRVTFIANSRSKYEKIDKNTNCKPVLDSISSNETAGEEKENVLNSRGVLSAEIGIQESISEVQVWRRDNNEKRPVTSELTN